METESTIEVTRACGERRIGNFMGTESDDEKVLGMEVMMAA